MFSPRVFVSLSKMSRRFGSHAFFVEFRPFRRDSRLLDYFIFACECKNYINVSVDSCMATPCL